MAKRFHKNCPECSTIMTFYPGCCGNLPIWRCANCGTVVKWEEKKNNAETYVNLR